MKWVCHVVLMRLTICMKHVWMHLIQDLPCQQSWPEGDLWRNLAECEIQHTLCRVLIRSLVMPLDGIGLHLVLPFLPRQKRIKFFF